MATEARITIAGMSCGHCVAAVERALRGVSGVQEARVEIGSAAVRFDPAATGEDGITAAIENEGYEVRLFDTGGAQ